MKRRHPHKAAPDRGVIGALISERLEFQEEWDPDGRFSFLAGRIRSHKNFKAAFEKLMELECNWAVMLTCLLRTVTYNVEEVLQPVIPLTGAAKEASETASEIQDGFARVPDIAAAPIYRYRSKIMPPAAQEREQIRAQFKATLDLLKHYDTLLFELANYSTFEDGPWGPDLTADEAHMLLPRLLRWTEKLLTAQPIGNARTIANVGQLVPCVYVELLVSRRTKHLTPATRRILPWLKCVAEILNEVEPDKRLAFRSAKKSVSKTESFSDSQLAEALRRFKRDYPNVYKSLQSKLRWLHNQPRPSTAWQEAYLRDIPIPTRR